MTPRDPDVIPMLLCAAAFSGLLALMCAAEHRWPAWVDRMTALLFGVDLETAARPAPHPFGRAALTSGPTGEGGPGRPGRVGPRRMGPTSLPSRAHANGPKGGSP